MQMLVQLLPVLLPLFLISLALSTVVVLFLFASYRKSTGRSLYITMIRKDTRAVNFRVSGGTQSFQWAAPGENPILYKIIPTYMVDGETFMGLLPIKRLYYRVGHENPIDMNKGGESDPEHLSAEIQLGIAVAEATASERLRMMSIMKRQQGIERLLLLLGVGAVVLISIVMYTQVKGMKATVSTMKPAIQEVSDKIDPLSVYFGLIPAPTPRPTPVIAVKPKVGP